MVNNSHNYWAGAVYESFGAVYSACCTVLPLRLSGGSDLEGFNSGSNDIYGKTRSELETSTTESTRNPDYFIAGSNRVPAHRFLAEQFLLC
jgi:hypothetical protein